MDCGGVNGDNEIQFRGMFSQKVDWLSFAMVQFFQIMSFHSGRDAKEAICEIWEMDRRKKEVKLCVVSIAMVRDLISDSSYLI